MMTTNPTIAIVNNERNLVTTLRMHLESKKFKVRTYSNTADALQLIENPADVALIDRTNSPISGIELFRRIRAHHAMPVIFLSAWAEEIEEELRGTSMEAEGYIPLPLSLEITATRIREVLQGYRFKSSDCS